MVSKTAKLNLTKLLIEAVGLEVKTKAKSCIPPKPKRKQIKQVKTSKNQIFKSNLILNF